MRLEQGFYAISIAAHCFYFTNVQPEDFQALLHARVLDFKLNAIGLSVGGAKAKNLTLGYVSDHWISAGKFISTFLRKLIVNAGNSAQFKVLVGNWPNKQMKVRNL